jgi:hypothetical protein
VARPAVDPLSCQQAWIVQLLVERVDVQEDALEVSPSMTLAGPVRQSVHRLNVKNGDETPEHSATVRCQISGEA